MVNTRKNSKQKPAKRSSSFIRQPRNVSFTSPAVPQRRSTRNRNASDNSKSKQSDESSSLRSSIITLNKPSREKNISVSIASSVLIQRKISFHIQLAHRHVNMFLHIAMAVRQYFIHKKHLPST